MTDDRFILAVLVSNQFGVLSRVSGLFARRGFNIDTLTVGTTENPEFSRITVTARGNEKVIEQFIKQLSKLQDVKKIEFLPKATTVVKELLLIKVKISNKTRREIMDAATVFHSKVVDLTTASMTIEITGEDTKLDAFIEYLRPYGILEICRTGVVALERGKTTLTSTQDAI